MTPAAARTDRYVLTIELRDDPGVVEAYRRHHAAVWPEVVSSFAAAGIQELEVYLLGQRLVMIVEVDGGLDLRQAFEAHSSSTPRVAEWERLMSTMQRPAPEARQGEWWALMERVCRIGGVPAAREHAPRLSARST